MAFYLLTETSLADELKQDYPNGNIIYREDYQKSFKKQVRWEDTKRFLREYLNFEFTTICFEFRAWDGVRQLLQRGERPRGVPSLTFERHSQRIQSQKAGGKDGRHLWRRKGLGSRLRKQ